MKKTVTQGRSTGLTNTERLTKTLGVLMRKNADTQTVTLDEFMERHPKIPVEEMIDFLDGLPKTKGDFIAGRRGHPSRYVFGEAHQKWLHMEVVRAEWRKRNGLNPATGGPLKPQRRGRKPADLSEEVATAVRKGGRAKTLVINGVTYQPVA